MIKKFGILTLVASALLACDGQASNQVEGTTFATQGKALRPRLDILNWEQDLWLPFEGDSAQRLGIPSLTQPFYNAVYDVHATSSARDFELIFSTNGNWHFALRRLLGEVYFPANPSVQESNLLTTSPPISVAQMQTGRVKAGNILYVNAEPHVVVAPGRVLDTLEANGFLTGPRTNIIRTYGNVILKRRGDPRYRKFWDLRRVRPGRFASSDPAEGGSYNNYRNSVLNIALNNPRRPNLKPDRIQAEAEALQEQLFDKEGVVTIGPPMHRSLPHVIATGEADAGLFFLHLAVTAMRENPGVFTAVYLADGMVGETDDPDVLAQGQVPLVGNQVPTFGLTRTVTPVNVTQSQARENFITALQSPEFTQILTEVGLRRP
ncbi:MAG: substrate-binding domain-containing protein [Myxococcota bacterium]